MRAPLVFVCAKGGFMLAVESNDYIHWYFSDYTDMHGAAQIQLLAAGKTQILNTMLGKMTAIAHTKVGLAFGGAKVTEDLKQELFSLYGGGSSLQARLQQAVDLSAGSLLISQSGANAGPLQSLAAMDHVQRNAYISQLCSDMSSLQPFINQASEMLSYYTEVAEYQKSVVLALAAQEGQLSLAQTQLKRAGLPNGRVDTSRLNSDVALAVENYKMVEQLNRQLQRLAVPENPGDISEISKALRYLPRLFKKFGWKIKEVADAFALNEALSLGEKNVVPKAVQSGKTTKTLSGTGLLNMIINQRVTLDSRLSMAINQPNNSSYSGQIKADSFGLFVSKSGVQGIIELSSKNYQEHNGNLVKPVSLQSSVTIQRGIDIASRYMPNGMGQSHFYKNLIGARANMRKHKIGRGFSEGDLSSYWDNYKEMVGLASFLQLLSGEFTRNSFGNNAMFIIVNGTVLSLFDIIEKIRIQASAGFIGGITGLEGANRVAEDNRAISSSKGGKTQLEATKERSTKVNADVQAILNMTFVAKLNMAMLSAL